MNVIEKLCQIAREKEAQRNEHKRRQEEEMELLKGTKVKEELKIVERGVLNIQLLAIKLLSYSSSLECGKWKVYNEKIQFVQMIIHNIDTIGTSAIEFLCRSKQHWHARKQIGPRATSIDPLCIEESEEHKVEEHHFVEAQLVQKDVQEDNVVVKEEQLSIKV